MAFLKNKNFTTAYKKACKVVGYDSRIHYRIHQIFWAGEYTRNIKGHIVELGTGTGFSMLALLNYLNNWNRSTKKLYLFDTFSPYKVNEFGELTSKKIKVLCIIYGKYKKKF